jgi:hypothetical protein
MNRQNRRRGRDLHENILPLSGRKRCRVNGPTISECRIP